MPTTSKHLNQRAKMRRKEVFMLLFLHHHHVWLSYLVAVYEVEDQVYVSVHWLVLSQLRLHSVQPVNQSLQGVRELSGEQQRLLQLVLPARERKDSVNSSRLGDWEAEVEGRGGLPYLSTDLPHTVSHLSLNSLSMSSSFCLSSWRLVLSLSARPVRLVVSYTECLLPRAFWNSCQSQNITTLRSSRYFRHILILPTILYYATVVCFCDKHDSNLIEWGVKQINGVQIQQLQRHRD